MLPTLFSLGPITISSYGVLLVLAFLMGSFAVWKRTRDGHLEEGHVFDVLGAVMVTALVFMRLGYIGLHWEDFTLRLDRWINIFYYPGLWAVWGLLGAMLAIVIESKRRKLNPYVVADTLTPGAVLFTALMYLAAFLDGSGYGVPTDWIVGVTFTGLYDKRVPVQLMGMLLYFWLYVYVWKVESAYRTFAWYKGNRSQAKAGFVVGVFLALSGLIEVILELMRPAYAEINGLRIDILLYVVVGLWGILLLIARSGNGFTLFSWWIKHARERRDKKRVRREAVASRLGEDILS